MRADCSVALYLFSILVIVLTESLWFEFGGRQLLEGLAPMLELAILVTLTYDRRMSWTSRVCNTRFMQWLGDISMSFYMIHMMIVFAVSGAFKEIEQSKEDGLPPVERWRQMCSSELLAEANLQPEDVFDMCLGVSGDLSRLTELDPDWTASDCTECSCLGLSFDRWLLPQLLCVRHVDIVADVLK